MRLRATAKAGISVLVLMAVAISGAARFTGTSRPVNTIVVGPAPLTDLKPGPDTLDKAWAQVIAMTLNGETRVVLVVTGISRSAVGMTFGAHVHIGPCVAGNGAAAMGHYNTGGPPSPTTEVWLDFRVGNGGTGIGRTTVPFVIPAGAANSVVIHEMATAPGGAAGARLACLPVAF